MVVEGVARGLDPQFDMWQAAEPALRDWAENILKADRRLRDATAEGAATLKKLESDLPELLSKTERVIRKIADNALSGGVRFDDTTIKTPADERRRHNHSGCITLWIRVGAPITLVLVRLL